MCLCSHIVLRVDGLAVVGTKYSAHQTKVEKYSVDRLSLAGVWLLPIGANYMKNMVHG